VNDEAWARQDHEHEQYLAAGLPLTRSKKDTNMGMTLDDFSPSKYLKKEDIDGEVIVTIKGIKKQNMARDDAEPEYKHILYFDEYEKGMVLNKTNGKRIFNAYPNTDQWKGKKIRLTVDENVEYAGKIVGGLRVSVPKGGMIAGKTSEEINREFDRAVSDSDTPF